MDHEAAIITIKARGGTTIKVAKGILMVSPVFRGMFEAAKSSPSAKPLVLDDKADTLKYMFALLRRDSSIEIPTKAVCANVKVVSDKYDLGIAVDLMVANLLQNVHNDPVPILAAAYAIRDMRLCEAAIHQFSANEVDNPVDWNLEEIKLIGVNCYRALMTATRECECARQSYLLTPGDWADVANEFEF